MLQEVRSYYRLYIYTIGASGLNNWAVGLRELIFLPGDKLVRQGFGRTPSLLTKRLWSRWEGLTLGLIVGLTSDLWCSLSKFLLF